MWPFFLHKNHFAKKIDIFWRTFQQCDDLYILTPSSNYRLILQDIRLYFQKLGLGKKIVPLIALSVDDASSWVISTFFLSLFFKWLLVNLMTPYLIIKGVGFFFPALPKVKLSPEVSDISVFTRHSKWNDWHFLSSLLNCLLIQFWLLQTFSFKKRKSFLIRNCHTVAKVIF